MLAYGRDFMIDKGFTYCIPPFMIHGNVVAGVMSQTDMDAMMYKIEGEDLYLIGTSEHSMIGKFIEMCIRDRPSPPPSARAMTCSPPCSWPTISPLWWATDSITTVSYTHLHQSGPWPD